MRLLRPTLSSLALCTLALGGCAPTGPTATAPPLPPLRADTIARLRVDGPNAFINDRPAPHGSYVVDGDRVSTGPGTSAILVLNDGGEIQLDQNTDPLFRRGVCLLMKIGHGRVAFRNLKCQEFEDDLKMAGVAHSFVNITSLENESRVTVIAGEVEMRSPEPATLGADAEYVATGEGAVQVRQLTPEESAARVAWVRDYFAPRAVQAAPGLSPVEAGTIGTGIGILMDLLGRRHHAPARQEPAPRGQTQPQLEAPPQPAPASPPPAAAPPPSAAPRDPRTVPAQTDGRDSQNQGQNPDPAVR